MGQRTHANRLNHERVALVVVGLVVVFMLATRLGALDPVIRAALTWSCDTHDCYQ